MHRRRASSRTPRRTLRLWPSASDAIGAGDPEAAERAVRGHLREILSDLPEIFEEKPEFFDPPGR